jgi:hypothetical protein
MPIKQGDLALLNDPVAQELLHSTIPARLAYVWRDGTPRVVPIWFHWNGVEIVLGTPLQALKVEALVHHPQVALTIDSDTGPTKSCKSAGRRRSRRSRGWCRSMRRRRSGTWVRSRNGWRTTWSKHALGFRAWPGLSYGRNGWES